MHQTPAIPYLLVLLLLQAVAGNGLRAQLPQGKEENFAPWKSLARPGWWEESPLRGHHFLPPIPGRKAHLNLWGTPGETRWHELEVGLFRADWTFKAQLQSQAGAALVLGFGTNPWRSRGFALDLGTRASAKVSLYKLGVGGRELLRSAAWPTGINGGEAFGIEVSLKSSSLKLRMAGRKVTASGGWPLRGSSRKGRWQIGARGAGLQLKAAELKGGLSTTSSRRLGRLSGRMRSQVKPKEALPLPRNAPLIGPIENTDFETLARGHSSQDARILQKAWELAIQGKIDDALELADSVHQGQPEGVGARWLMGMIELIHRSEAGKALNLWAGLSNIKDLPALRGDAYWMLGRLDRAEAAYVQGKSTGGRALVAHAYGDDARAAELLAEGAAGGCQREGQRLRLCEDLGYLSRMGKFFKRSAGRVTVLSDASPAIVERVLRHAEPFLIAASDWLPGKARALPITICVCEDPRRFAFWNKRLGGARFEEADGIYRPGSGLLILLDDDDEVVLLQRLQHELTHHVVYERAWDLPRAFEEGLAEYLAPAKVRGRTLVLDRSVNGARLKFALSLAASKALASPDKALLRRALRDGDLGREDYAQAWASVQGLSTVKTELGITALRHLLTRVDTLGGSIPSDIKSWLKAKLSTRQIASALQALRKR